MIEIAAPLVLLFTLLIMMVAVKQYSEKKAEELRLFANKQRAIIRNVEEVLFDNQGTILSNRINVILRKRMLNALNKIAVTSLRSNSVLQQINTINSEINALSLDSDSQSIDIPFKAPAEDNEAIKRIKSIKAIRVILLGEQRSGRIDYIDYSNEDNALSSMQIKIATEANYNRGVSARAAGQQGTARESFQRALTILNSAKNQDKYIIDKIASANQHIQEITDSLKKDNQKYLEKRAEAEKDSLDVFFTPKKKW